LEKKFSDLSVEALTSKIIKIAEPLPTKIQSDPSPMEVDPFIFIFIVTFKLFFLSQFLKR